MKRCLIIFLPVLLLSSFHKPASRKVLVIQQSYNYKVTSGDTIFIQYHEPSIAYHVNDSVRIKCGADTANITTIFIANPRYLLKDIPFEKRFPRLKHLILAGDDEDYLDSVRYDFFNCPSLKRITISSMYMSEGPKGKGGRRAVQRFIKAARPDIRIRFKPMGHYSGVGWPDY